jgi:N-acylglucosamine 2-epimerase
MTIDWSATKQKYEQALYGDVIPFWERHCLDRDCGGYFTFLDRDGSVYDTEKFMWMQWRIVYVFAALHQRRPEKKEWLEIALHGYEFLTRFGKAEDGHYYFSLQRDGTPAAQPANIYSNLFAAMGAAALYRVTGDEAHRREAESAARNYVARLGNPKGKWEKSLRPPRKSLGHYMMLANLGQVLNESFGTDEYAGQIREAAATVLDKFWHPEIEVLFENINFDGSFDLQSCEGRFVTPGHGLESLWFLLRYAEQAGDAELIAKAAPMVRKILEFGWDEKYGGIFYFMDAMGKPHVELQHDMKLWWVHNEALLAALYAYRLTGEKIFAEWFEKIDAWTWAHFPDPEYGEWFGYLNRRGEATHLLKGGKWKTFFHLPRFLLEGADQMGGIIKK